MHRFNIASVYGDRIILDGTTIEEVRQYHKETLVLCVNAANQEEARKMKAQREAAVAKEKQKNDHLTHVNDIADRIEF